MYHSWCDLLVVAHVGCDVGNGTIYQTRSHYAIDDVLL